MQKIAVVIVAMLLILPCVGVEEIKGNSGKEKRIIKKEIQMGSKINPYLTSFENRISKFRLSDTFGFKIYTRYEGIEKETPIIQSILKGIDVDNNPDTGENGKDIKVSIIILPYIQKINGSWIFAISFALKVIRLGEEIKNGELEVYFKGVINYNGRHNIFFGFYSPKDEEIPKEIREVITVVPYLLYDKNPEFYINAEPVFDTTYSNISVVIEYFNNKHHKIIIDYYPSVPTMIKISPEISFKEFSFYIERYAEAEETVRLRYYGDVNISLTLEDIPEKMEFTMSYSENYFEYKASDEFNTSLTIEVLGMNACMRIEYLPRHLIAQFGQEGYFYVFIDERKTKFIVADDLEEPTSYFSITNLSGEAIIRWKTEQEGYITIDGMQGLRAEIKASLADTQFRMLADVKTEHFVIEWNISPAGYIFIDTNWEWLGFYSLNFTADDLFGMLIEANFMRADDFRVEWQFIPPSFMISGNIEFIGNATFAIMFNGVWYNVFG